MFAAIEQLGVDLSSLQWVAHGTTVGTNAILERTGARTALVVTKGFGDILELQREWKDRNYNLRFQKADPLVPRGQVIELDARMDAQGAEVEPITDEGLRQVVASLEQLEIDAVAICLLNAYRNPAHEEALAAYLAEHLPHLHLHSSHTVAPEIREFERTSTTVLSAYIGPALAEYLDRMEKRLSEQGFTGSLLVTQCNGGLATPAEIASNAAASLLSGPAAGVEGAVAAASAEGIRDFVTMDMGGTSTDLSLVRNGSPTVASGTEIERWPLALPLIDVRAVGAGGGSIISSAAAGLRVGPRSAGAEPGPACYGRGGNRPTLTDALAATGFLRDGRRLGGVIPVDQSAASASLNALAAELGSAPRDVADAAVAVAVAELSHQVRLLTLEQGLDPRDFWLIAYGGAGPMFGGWVAQELSLRGAVIPAAAGLLSAVGLMVAPYRRDFVSTLLERVEGPALTAVRDTFAELEQRAHAVARTHLGHAEVTYERSLDLRYVGQGFELEISPDGATSAADLADAFHSRHREVFGYSISTDPVEVVRCRLTVEADLARTMPRIADEPSSAEPANVEAIRGGKAAMWTAVDAATLDVIKGPSIIESLDTTIIVPAGMAARRSERGAVIIE